VNDDPGTETTGFTPDPRQEDLIDMGYLSLPPGVQEAAEAGLREEARVQRFRRRQAAEMIRWDGSSAAFRAIEAAGGQPKRLGEPWNDGRLGIRAGGGVCHVLPGDWVMTGPGGNRVLGTLAAAVQARDYEPVTPGPASAAGLAAQWRAAAARWRGWAAAAQEPYRAERRARAEVYDECADAIEARGAPGGGGGDAPARSSPREMAGEQPPAHTRTRVSPSETLTGDPGAADDDVPAADDGGSP
jgi:hypothetical protein